MLEEVQQLLDSGLSPTCRACLPLATASASDVLAGQMDVEQAKVEMRRLTRIFIRRQANWFKLDDPSIHWFEAGKVRI